MKLPVLTPEELCKFLEREGFELIRQKGSHRFFRHHNGRATVVPMHSRKPISRGLLRGILREIDMDREEFMEKSEARFFSKYRLPRRLLQGTTDHIYVTAHPQLTQEERDKLMSQVLGICGKHLPSYGSEFESMLTLKEKVEGVQDLPVNSQRS